MAEPGQTKQYRYYLDPLMGEGSKVFRSGGESTQMTVHGLFGTLIAEPAGARWYDPQSGEDRTDDTSWSNWEAMIRPPGGMSFREFTLIYHEVGDEAFNLRRPLRENDEGVPFGGDDGKPHGDQVQYGRPLPMIDTRPRPRPSPTRAAAAPLRTVRAAGRSTTAASRSCVGRSWRPHAAPPCSGPTSPLAYSSYSYGDPATPMPRSYLGRAHQDPARARRRGAAPRPPRARRRHPLAAQPGSRRHGDGLGTDQDADPEGQVGTARLADRQPAGVVQPGARVRRRRLPARPPGDFLYHCHISQHYVTGMWGLWQVFDTAQPTLGPTARPGGRTEAVNSRGPAGHHDPGQEGRSGQGPDRYRETDRPGNPRGGRAAPRRVRAGSVRAAPTPTTPRCGTGAREAPTRHRCTRVNPRPQRYGPTTARPVRGAAGDSVQSTHRQTRLPHAEAPSGPTPTLRAQRTRRRTRRGRDHLGRTSRGALPEGMPRCGTST